MTRIRVSLSSSEVEIEGSEDFIAKYDDTLGAMLQRVREGKVVAPKADGQESPAKNQGEFGEVLHSLSGATDTDKILLAGSFAQKSSSDNAFPTGAANSLLIEQGIKVSNPSQCMTNNLKAKRVFKVGSKYRVSKDGETHLKKLGA